MNKNYKDLTPAKKLALSAIFSALGVVLLTVGSFIEVLDMASAALAGFVVVIAVIEIRGHYPVLMYFVISVLAVLLLPNKYPAVFFIFFSGFYPILKAQIERLHYITAWIVKFSMFNLFLVFMILAVNFLIARGFLPPVENNDFNNNLFVNIKILVFVIANFTFLLYDIAMTRIINLYIIKIRGLIGLKNYF